MQILQERIEYYSKELKARLSYPVTIKVADELLKLDLVALVNHFKMEMNENFQYWYEKYGAKLKDKNEKIGCVFFEHSYPYYDEDTRAEAYGIYSDSETDEYGLYSHYEVIENFESSGEITLKTFKPLAIYEQEEISKEVRNDYNFSSEKESVLETYYMVNSLILGQAINETFYASKFATICARPFYIEIQEHDMSDNKNIVSYLFGDRDEREYVKNFNYDLLTYEIETLFENAINHIKELSDISPIYNIKFIIDNCNCSLIFEDKNSSDEAVKNAISVNEEMIRYYTNTGNLVEANLLKEESASLDRNYYKSSNSIYEESFSVFSIPNSSDDKFDSEYFFENSEIVDEIIRIVSETFKTNQSSLKELPLHQECILIAFGDILNKRGIWKV